jgi:predicted amidophosphoribosyltransferase
MRCSACGGENSDGKRFCGDCGESLAIVCAACGALLESGRRFCGDCGSPASAAAPAALVPMAHQAQNTTAPTTELRHVSVLFCDLVGFTSACDVNRPNVLARLGPGDRWQGRLHSVGIWRHALAH